MYTCRFWNNWGNCVKVSKQNVFNCSTRDEAISFMNKFKFKAMHLGVSWFQCNDEWFQLY